jgi:hypothetical protein
MEMRPTFDDRVACNNALCSLSICHLKLNKSCVDIPRIAEGKPFDQKECSDQPNESHSYTIAHTPTSRQKVCSALVDSQVLKGPCACSLTDNPNTVP